MALTRPSSYPVVSGAPALVSQEVAEIDERGRLRFHPRWTNRVSWWKTNQDEAFAVLMVLQEPGRIALRAWTNDGDQIAARYAELAASDDEEALEALRLIQDRYQKLPIDKEYRAHLGDPALTHLGLTIERGRKSTVYVVVYPDQLNILSVSYRNEKLVSGSRWLDDLP
jgi:hypothetical protein